MSWRGELFTLCMYRTRTWCDSAAVARDPDTQGWWLCAYHYHLVTGRWPR